jgi:glutamine---fructose-6-phosphate transaminase (isomerizing)
MTRSHFESEIREQPEALARLLAGERPVVEHIAAAVHRFSPAFVVTAARGSSDNAARYAKYLFGAHNRLVLSLGAPSLITLYGAPPALDRALVLGISQSGQSPDIVALVQEGRRQGALTVAITNQVGSPLAAAAHHVIDLHAGPEQAVVASKSYTAELVALAMLSAALEAAGGDAATRGHAMNAGQHPSGAARRWQALESLPAAVSATIALSDGAGGDLASLLAPVGGTPSDRMIVLGRGFNFATAFEIALKVKETAYLLCEPYATPDFFHGPLALVEAGFPALVVAPAGATVPDVLPALDVLAARQARVAVLSDDPRVLAHPAASLRLPITGGVPEWLSPVTAVIPGQFLALALARARGHDPDRPRGLSKVTRTH